MTNPGGMLDAPFVSHIKSNADSPTTERAKLKQKGRDEMVDDATRELIVQLSNQIDADRSNTIPSHVRRKGERAYLLVHEIGVRRVRDEFPKQWQDLLEFNYFAAMLQILAAGLEEDALKMRDVFISDRIAKIQALRPELTAEVIKAAILIDGSGA